MNSSVSVRPVLSKQDKKLFLDVPFALYDKGSNWVAPLYFERFEHLDPKKNPYFQHAETQLFLAEVKGKHVGRISAQIDRLHLERYHDGTGQFGFLEATNEPEVFAALFNAAEGWLKSRGIHCRANSVAAIRVKRKSICSKPAREYWRRCPNRCRTARASNSNGLASACIPDKR